MDTKRKSTSATRQGKLMPAKRFRTIMGRSICPGLLVFALSLGSINTFGQGVGISEISIVPHSSSILELRSIDRGLLVPRMTTVARNAIVNPANGLIVYNEDHNSLNIYEEVPGLWRIIFSGSSSGVNSITGTMNRISIGGTAADPVIDIDGDYIGQPSINTLGTITAGTWNAGIIPVLYGGTGVNTFGGTNTVLYTTSADVIASVPTSSDAGQFLQTTTAGGAPSWKTVLDVVNGGTGRSLVTENHLLYGNNDGVLNTLAPGATEGALLTTTGTGAPGWLTLNNLPPTSGILQEVNGGTGESFYAEGELLIGNTAGGLTRSSLTGTPNRVLVTNGNGTITLTTPQDIHLGASPEFTGLTISGLTANSGVYTDNSSALTSIPPLSGTIGYWNRTGTTLSPVAVGDNITTSGNISATGTGTITSMGMLTGNSGLDITAGGADIVGGADISGGADIYGGVINLNVSSNNATNINTGTSEGDIRIGNSQNNVIMPAFTSAGVVHNDANGVLYSGLIQNEDIEDGEIDLTEKVTNVLPIVHGGTNSGVALSGSSIMISNGSAIVQGEAGTTSTVLHGNAFGAPFYGLVVTDDIADLNVTSGKLDADAVTTVKILDANVTRDKLADNAVNASKLAVAGDGTPDQVLISNGDGTFSWSDQSALTPDLSLGDLTNVGDDSETSANILIADGDSWESRAVSGDAGINNTGLLTISPDAVTTSKILNSNVTYGKIQDVSTSDVVLGRISVGSGVIEEISTTGTGSVVRSTSPVLVTPALGTPSVLIGTNITGTASGLTAGTVTTNANLTGPITSVGNVTSIASYTGTGTTFVMNTSPVLVTPDIGVATATSVNGLALSSEAIGFSLSGGTDSKTLVVTDDATISGTISGTNTGDITLSGENYLSLVGQALTANAVDLSGTNATGILAAGRFPALTGDVTTLVGSLGAIISPDAVTTSKILNSNVTYGKIQDVSTSDVVLGRISVGSGVIEEISTTGTGSVVRSNSPVLVTPALGTPSVLVGTNITGTASGLTAGTVTTNANLTGPITSVGNVTSVANQTGTGTTFVMNTSPVLVTPDIGVAIATSVNGLTFSSEAIGFSLSGGTDSKTLTVQNSLILAGTDATTMVFPSTNAIIARTDAGQTFSGVQTFSSAPVISSFTQGSILFAGAGGSLSQDNDNLHWDNSNKRLGVGQSSPAAILHLRAGTSAPNTAPLKFTAGDNLSTTEAGALEYDGDNLSITDDLGIRYTIAKTLTATQNLNFPSTSGRSNSDLTINLPGVDEGDAVSLGVPNVAVLGGSNYSAWVSAANTVTVRFNNYTVGNLDPDEGIFRVTIVKY